MRKLENIQKEIELLSTQAHGKGKDTITLVLTVEEFKAYEHVIDFDPKWTRIQGEEAFVHIKL